MANIVDKRFTPKDAATGNRQKFIKRYKSSIKKAIQDAVNKGSIKDFNFKNKKIKVNGNDDNIDLPNVHNDRENGIYDYVHVGNKKFRTNDRINKPSGGKGRGNEGSQEGGGEDEFEFQLSESEFAELFFEDLELPEMIKKRFIGDNYEIQRCGYSTSGGPSSLNVKQTLIKAFARRKALEAQHKKDEEEAEDASLNIDLQPKRKKLAFIEDTDLRYNYRDKVDIPSTKAVMFCMLDVSGSMGEKEKDMAKRFFLLLSLFLRQNYDVVDIVFIRHAEWASEVDEQEFFHGKLSGGTIISTGYEKIKEIIDARYNPEQWNIYISQASDGDNWTSDNAHVSQLLTQQLLPITQYFAYTEIGSYRASNETSTVYKLLDKISGSFKNLQVRIIRDYKDIYSVFRSLFRKEKS